MRSLEPEQQYWLIEPLLCAGMDLDDIRTRLTLMAFDAVVGTPGSSPTRWVDDQPIEVRVAWAAMIGRMLSLDELVEG